MCRRTAIREAVRGRETEVLRALGIPWEDGARHISCPYPDHADQNPSWRWDERKAKAFCTCIERGGHSIFEIVMRIESIDFEAAKLRVAEILGRHDLIKTKGGQRMDAASLLQPPADQRDDAPREPLPRPIGSACRRSQVPMPSTRVVGWRELRLLRSAGGEGRRSHAWSGTTLAWCSARWRRMAGVTRIASTSRRTAPAKPTSASARTDVRATRRSRRG